MHALCYISEVVEHESQEAISSTIDNILVCSRRHNRDANITGLLAYAYGHFLQFLEGEQDRVETLFNSIERDPRHTNVELLHSAAINERTYPDWTMGAVLRSSRYEADSERIRRIRNRFGKDSLVSPADYFRYLLMPADRAFERTPGPVTKVAIFASSALWATPLFTAISDRFGAQAISTRVSDPDIGDSNFPFDYSDFQSPGKRHVRIMAFSRDMLGSAFIRPFLSDIELVLLLSRAGGGEAKIDFAESVLSLPDLANCKPHVISIRPDEDLVYESAVRRRCESKQYSYSFEHGSLLLGHDLLDFMLSWLDQRPALQSTDKEIKPVSDVPANRAASSAGLRPKPTTKKLPPNFVGANKPSTSPVTKPDAVISQIVDFKLADPILDRFVSRPGVLRLKLVSIVNSKVLVDKKSADEQADAEHEQRNPLNTLNPLAEELQTVKKLDLSEHLAELVITTTSRYEIMRIVDECQEIAICTEFDRTRTVLSVIREMTDQLQEEVGMLVAGSKPESGVSPRQP